MTGFSHDGRKPAARHSGPAGSTFDRPDRLAVPASVHRVLAQEGRPLSQPLRAAYEPSFGHDFSKIRVHADQLAASSAAQLDAAAYAVGNHLVFGEKRFPPTSPDQFHLLAHELAHAVQQNSAMASAGPETDETTDRQEHDADLAANRALGGEQRVASGLRSGPVALMRQAIATGGPPNRLPLDAIVQATAYAFEADETWNIHGTPAKRRLPRRISLRSPSRTGPPTFRRCSSAIARSSKSWFR